MALLSALQGTGDQSLQREAAQVRALIKSIGALALRTLPAKRVRHSMI